MKTVNVERLRWDFSFHPADEEKRQLHIAVRARVLSLVEYLDDFIPDSREKSLAVTKLEEAMFWANAGIARNPRPDDGD